MYFSWMVWTWLTTTFFVLIILLICMMLFLEYLSPGGGPKLVILSLDITSFVTVYLYSFLCGSFVHIAWFGILDITKWRTMAPALLFSIVIFKWV